MMEQRDTSPAEPKRSTLIGTTAFEAGRHDDVSMGAYLDDLAVSASLLWQVHSSSAAHARHEIDERPDDMTDPKALGNVLHYLIENEQEFDERYVVVGQCEAVKGTGERCQNQGTYWRDGQSFCGVKGHDPGDKAPMDPSILTVQADMKAQARRMHRALIDHPASRELLTAPGPREQTIVWQDKATGLWCRCRPDRQIFDPPTIRAEIHHSVVDLKSTGREAHPDKYPNASHNLGAYFKAAFYRMGLDAVGFWPHNFFYPVVEANEPHVVAVYRMNDDAIDVGESEVRRALEEIADAKRTGRWPGYGDHVFDLNLPAWRLKIIQRMDALEMAS